MSQFPKVDSLKKDGSYKEVMIRCRYCDLKDECHLRTRKEAYEAKGIKTYCPFTPNMPTSKKRKKKKKK